MDLRHHSHPCRHTGMDTSTAPHVSPVLEAETLAAPMVRYVEDREEVAYQYAHALVTFFSIDPDLPEALQPTRDIVTESTNSLGASRMVEGRCVMGVWCRSCISVSHSFR